MDLPPDTPPLNERILAKLKQLQTCAHQTLHRYLVVLSGDEHWVKNTLQFQLNALPKCHTLIVSDQVLHIAGDHCHAHKLKRYLGTETEQIVWNGFSSLNPDGFGAASGLLKGGGLFFLLLPELNKLIQAPDPDYLRMCTNDDELKHCGTLFLQRMVALITSDSDVTLIQQHTPLSNFIPNFSIASTPSSITLPSSGQIKMIEAIESVAKGHRKRPLVVYADRGRGKSSALGLAAAKIISKHNLKVLITAPNRHACDAAFQHSTSTASHPLALEFIAPDKLIETMPVCHLLLVDEAAAIPSPILKQMLTSYPRIVFATTVHGYEGNGQGFAVRFCKELDKQTPQWKSLSLKQAIRWADNDPLERWMFDFLMLKAQLPRLHNDVADRQTLLSKTKIRWIKQDELIVDHSLFNNITALLVLAHYQTSPSDIRLILDHPKVHLAVVEAQNTGRQSVLLGVILIMEEGHVEDKALTQAIFEGRRRPRGHLVPQALIASTGAIDFLAQRTYRIMRIAVHPDFTAQGLGSKLITAAKSDADKKKIDSLSSSFGLTPELMRFWRQNGFSTLKVGTHKDGASGTQSAIVFHAISSRSQHLLDIHSQQFKQNFLFALSKHHRNLAPENAYAVLSSLPHKQTQFSTNESAQLAAYIEHFRSFDDSLPVLSKFILSCFTDHTLNTITPQNVYLLIMRIFQGRSAQTCIGIFNLAGKKQLERLLKASIRQLLATRIS